MALRPAIVVRMARPVQSLWRRFAFGALVAAAFATMLFGKADSVVVERARLAIADAATPVLEVLAEPAGAVARAVEGAAALRDLHGEVARLREENLRLREWRRAAEGLQAENRALRRLARFVPPAEPDYISARAISNAGGPFVRSVLVNAGRRHGVRRGLAAVSGAGLAGVTVEVGELHARVLLVTDLNSRIPVTVRTTRDPGVLSGDNSNRPELLFLPQNAAVSTGDAVVTSGLGGALPPGIPVGTVASVGASGARVKPLVDWDRLEHLRLLDYRLDGVVPPPGGAAGGGGP